MEANWETPAGKLIDELSKVLIEKNFIPRGPIIVFGSGPLQIFIDPAFLSADVDVSAPEQTEELKKLVHEAKLDDASRGIFLQVVGLYIFRAGPRWESRAEKHTRLGIDYLFPAPIDLLLGKLRRLEEKDIRAFELVRQKKNEPTEHQLIHELKYSYDQFYIQKDGKKSDLWINAEKLWPRLFGRKVNVETEILEPVLNELKTQNSDTDYIQSLRNKLGLS